MMTMRCYAAVGPDERYTVLHAARDAAFPFSCTGESEGQQALSIDLTGCILTKPCRPRSSAPCVSKLAGVIGIFILVRDDHYPSLLVARFPVSHPRSRGERLADDILPLALDLYASLLEVFCFRIRCDAFYRLFARPRRVR